jgi:hypothetical protein
MKTIKNSKDITTLEVDDKVVFGDLEYFVSRGLGYFLNLYNDRNDKIFKVLKINKRDFIESLGIDANCNVDFPETKSLEALTAIVSALFKEYEKQNELPKTWEEFCERYPLKAEEVFINSASKINTVGDYISRKYRIPDNDRNLCTSREEAEAFLALMQLRQLRKAYVKDWEPDYKQQYYGIIFHNNGFNILSYRLLHKSMSFPTYDLAEQFLNNFKDLLEVAKPLL